MKPAHSVIADFIKPVLRPDVDANTIGQLIISQLQIAGYCFLDPTEPGSVVIDAGPALNQVSSKTPLPSRHLSDAGREVYCAALSGLYASENINHGLLADHAMKAVDAFIERTK